MFLAENNILDTLFRELLQNSDDACSRHVEIHYQTLSDPVGYEDMSQVTKRLCCQLVFKNDGVLFREEDWQRISRIAEGNPDEEKIGAFGVGFYSVFSICDGFLDILCINFIDRIRPICYVRESNDGILLEK